MRITFPTMRPGDLVVMVNRAPHKRSCSRRRTKTMDSPPCV